MRANGQRIRKKSDKVKPHVVGKLRYEADGNFLVCKDVKSNKFMWKEKIFDDEKCVIRTIRALKKGDEKNMILISSKGGKFKYEIFSKKLTELEKGRK